MGSKGRQLWGRELWGEDGAMREVGGDNAMGVGGSKGGQIYGRKL